MSITKFQCGKILYNVSMDKTTKIANMVKKISKDIEESRKDGTLLIGSPFGLTLNGKISSGKEGASSLAIGLEHDVGARLDVMDWETGESENEDIDLSCISSVNITMCPGDAAQAQIETYDGSNISCTLSSVKLTFNDSRASDFIIGKHKQE